MAANHPTKVGLELDWSWIDETTLRMKKLTGKNYSRPRARAFSTA